MLKSKEELAQLKAQLSDLNDDVKAVMLIRREWMDTHMADFARHPIGTEVFELETGRSLGVISEYYRYQASTGSELYDTSMEIHYTFTNGDNTSRQRLNTTYSVGDAKELAARLQTKANELLMRDKNVKE